MSEPSLSHPFGGVYAATVCPMHEDGAIDVAGLERHLADVGAVDGMAGFLVNGHAGENFALDREELTTVVRTARAVEGATVVAGVNAEVTREVATLAEDAAAAGADAVMVFPPFSWALGADPRLIVAHHRAVADACDLPLFLFQGSVGAGKTAYTPEVLTELLAIPSVVGIKEGSWETAAYDATRRLTKRLRPDVGVMASGDEHLFACFAIGSEGSLVSLAAVVPELIVALDRAMVATPCDLSTARDIHDRLYTLARTVYGPPGHLATLRLKTCLALLGKQTSTATRTPLRTLSENEVTALGQALHAAGILSP